jgi:hypothetical protein
MTKKEKEESGNVSFRLTAKHIRKLSALADRVGVSRHQHAQRIVETALDGREEEATMTRIELADLRAEIEATRAGLVKILTGLVASGGMPLEEARVFVRQAFTRKASGKK